MNRRAMLAKVHLAKKDLGLSDDDYRAILARVAHRRSAGDCTEQQLDAVLREFRRLGWRAKRGTKRSDVPEVRKVWALWASMCKRGLVRTPTRAALRAFVKRMTGVADPEWMSRQQAVAVIEGLKAWEKRASRSAEGEPAKDGGTEDA